MAQTTQPETAPDTPRAFGYCCWHGKFSEDVRLIEVIEQGSGSGPALYACPPCRGTFRLVPLADRS